MSPDASAGRGLPNFALGEYLQLLEDLVKAGYRLLPASGLASGESGRKGRTAHLRHDVDFHIALVETMATAEAEQGISATYYVLLTQHYNLWQKDNRTVLRRLVELGHEIGLHYDLETYPSEPVAARRHLQWEAETLEALSGTRVRTIAMHQPSLAGGDPFRTLDEHVHPHDPRLTQSMLYVSDSCRLWRDESLLRCFRTDPPARLLLNTHPELWLNPEIADPMAYLDYLIEASTVPYGEFIDTVVRKSWTAHHAQFAR